MSGPTDTGKVGTPSAIAARLASKIFAERKGHGGAAVSYMQISESSLANMIEAGIDADRAINSRNAHDDMKAALEKIAGYSPASTIQPVAIAREALAALSRAEQVKS